MLEKHSVYVAGYALVHDCAERASRFFARFLKREEVYVFVVSHADIIQDFSCNDKSAKNPVLHLLLK